MSLTDAISSSAQPIVTWTLVVLTIITIMFFGRMPAHRAILSLTRALHNGLRLASRSLLSGADRMIERNREVLFAAGREAKERIVEREFDRIAAAVQRDLAEGPSLNRRLAEIVTRMEDDHAKGTDVPPAPPGWANVVKTVAEVDAKGDPVVATLLETIQDSIEKSQEQATRDYRAASRERHQHLKSMAPHWRKAQQVLTQLDEKVSGVLQRTKVVDRHVEEYQEILRKTDRAQRELSSSSLVQFFVSAFVLSIAVGGAIVNFNLIARPMAEMVGGSSAVGGFRAADVAALVIILLELTMGLFLMESLRITRLFPVIGALPDKMRVRMLWITLTLLTALAAVESGLAYMREVLMEDQLATSALLRGETGAAAQVQFQWITTMAQMGMGFILPFVLAFVAIPLETFVQSLRTVLGVVAVALVRGVATLLRVLAEGARLGGKLLVDVYDVVIFAPLWVGQQIKPDQAEMGGRSARAARSH